MLQKGYMGTLKAASKLQEKNVHNLDFLHHRSIVLKWTSEMVQTFQDVCGLLWMCDVYCTLKTDHPHLLGIVLIIRTYKRPLLDLLVCHSAQAGASRKPTSIYPPLTESRKRLKRSLSPIPADTGCPQPEHP